MAEPLVLNIRITSPRVESRRSYSVRTDHQSVEDRIEVVFDAADDARSPKRRSFFTPRPASSGKLAPITPRVALSSSRGARSAVVATDARGTFVVVGLSGGFIAMYESALYVWKPEPVNTKLWSQPLFVAAMGAVATFQFYRSKNSSGRRFDAKPGGFGADADALRRFDRMTRASRGPDASFDPAAFRKQMERDGRWKRATRE